MLRLLKPLTTWLVASDSSNHAPSSMLLVIQDVETITLIWFLPSIGFEPSPVVLCDELLI